MKASKCPAKGKKGTGQEKRKVNVKTSVSRTAQKCKRLFTSTSFTTRHPAKLLGRMGLSDVLYMTFSYFMYIIFRVKINVQKCNVEIYRQCMVLNTQVGCHEVVEDIM